MLQDHTIKDADLVNSVNSRGFTMSNRGQEINREVLLTNYTDEAIQTTWSVLCQYVAKNYNLGKGTIIKGFGTFTFDNAKVNLEGTTNQYIRDQRARQPVFIVSPEFSDYVKPGQYTKNGVIYYTQKLNNSVNHVKVNYAEIAYGNSISKDEAENIIKHLVKFIADSIKNGTFKNKDLPHVGVLMVNRNVLGVKFNDNLIQASQKKPQKLQFTKRSVQLGMDMSNAQSTSAYEVRNPYKNIEDLRPNLSVTTKITPCADRYLKENYDIDVNSIPEHEVKKIYRPFSQSQTGFPLKFLNDKLKNKKVYVNGIKLKDMNLDKDIIESFEFYKSTLIKNMKAYDASSSGRIRTVDCIEAFMNSRLNPKITQEMATDIIQIYAKKLDLIDYMKFIACLVKDSQLILDNLNNLGARSNSTTNKMGKTINTFGTLNNLRKKVEISKTPSNQLASKIDFFTQKKKDLDSIQKELTVLKEMLPSLKNKFRLSLDQNISTNEFSNILTGFSITYPKDKIYKILNFLEIPNPDAFCILELEEKINNCKILTSNLSTKEILSIFSQIKDIIFIGGGKNFLFKNSDSVSCADFVSLIKSKSNLDTDEIRAVFYYLVKTDRNFTVEDYSRYIEGVKRVFDQNFEIYAMKTIANLIEKKHLKTDEYFDHLLTYNINTKNKVLSRPLFVKVLIKEKLPFSAEENDYIFTYMDTKKDNVIDREEFVNKVSYVQQPLTIIQELIKRNHLDIEDLAHKMKIDIKSTDKMTFEQFRDKIKILDYTLSNEFILSMFNSLKQGNTVDTQHFLDELNTSKKEFIRSGGKTPYIESFTKHYMEVIKKNSTFTNLKKMFEGIDQNFNGIIPRTGFVDIMKRVTPDFTDEEHMKFVRITDKLDVNNNIKYPELLNLIYFNEKADNFTHLVEILKNAIRDKFANNLDKFFLYINKALKVYPISFDRLNKYITEEIKDDTVFARTLCKLDVDADGMVSYEDLRCILERYTNTSFFRHENKENLPNINLYPSETMKEEKAKLIVKKLKQYMKMKNITEIGLFHKIDKNNDGFISPVDFHSTIDSIIHLAPSLKDQFFNFLDYYHNGLVDLETFIFRFKDFATGSTIVRNNNKIENDIIDAFTAFIKKNSAMCDTEIFELLDRDCDGVVGINDFRYFVLNSLGFAKFEFNDFKLERVMQALSLTKNKQIGINDIKEFMNVSKSSSNENYHMNLKEIFKITTNMNLAPNKANKSWTNEIIERFGMFISERYDSISDFFSQATEKGSEKFKFEDFLRFHENNYECFNNGFNLTKDELLSIYTALDSQKKNYLTLEDLENKLQIFDYYKKMHIDVKTFIKQNFCNGVDAFKFFIKNNNPIPNTMTLADLTKVSLTKKEFFDAFDYFFPKKYRTETILKYMRKNFKNIEKIPFSEFNFIYFDKIQSDLSFIQQRQNETKLITSRGDSLFHSHADFYPKDKMLQTPFDCEPLNKVKRIVQSTKFDLVKFFNFARTQSSNGIVNKFQFRNIIKSLDIGLTNLEIDQIMSRCGRLTYDGKMNINDFIKYLREEDNILYQGKNNVAQVIGDIKHLIYKYYANPIVCFQFNDKAVTLKLDFEKFKQIVMEMYRRDQMKPPSFTLLKNAYDTLDLRKDGLIDMNEWMRGFGSYNGSLDYAPKTENGFEFFSKTKKRGDSFTTSNRRILREWESSGDICDLYKMITKSKKLIKDKLRKFLLSDGGDVLVQADNLVTVIKEVLPQVKLSYTQWKMLVLIGKTDVEGLIDLNLFFKMVETTASNMRSHPKKLK